MNRTELIKRASKRVWFSETAMSMAFDIICDEIINGLSRGEEVKLGSLGTFALKERAARIGRNPHTGEAVPIPERVMPVFKLGSALKRVESPRK